MIEGIEAAFPTVALRRKPVLRGLHQLRVLRSPASYSQAHRQVEKPPRLEQCLVEAVNHCGMMIVGDGQVESVSGPNPVSNRPRYRLARPKSSAVGKRMEKVSSTTASNRASARSAAWASRL